MSPEWLVKGGGGINVLRKMFSFLLPTFAHVFLTLIPSLLQKVKLFVIVDKGCRLEDSITYFYI